MFPPNPFYKFYRGGGCSEALKYMLYYFSLKTADMPHAEGKNLCQQYIRTTSTDLDREDVGWLGMFSNLL